MKQDQHSQLNQNGDRSSQNQQQDNVTNTSHPASSSSPSLNTRVKSSPKPSPISQLTPNGNLPNQSTAITAAPVNHNHVSGKQNSSAHLQAPHHERNHSNASLVSVSSVAMPSHLPTGFVVAFHRKMVRIMLRFINKQIFKCG